MRVVLVYKTEEGLAALQQASETAGYAVVASLAAGDSLELIHDAPDIDAMIVALDRADAALLAQLRRLNELHPLPVVIFANRGGERDTINDAVAAGVMAFVVDGLTPGRLAPIVEVALARFRAFHSLRRELCEARGRLEERKFIDRAKGILMQQKAMTEEEAYRTLRKLAMDRNIRLGEAASNVIAMAELFRS